MQDRRPFKKIHKHSCKLVVLSTFIGSDSLMYVQTSPPLRTLRLSALITLYSFKIDCRQRTVVESLR